VGTDTTTRTPSPDCLSRTVRNQSLRHHFSGLVRPTGRNDWTDPVTGAERVPACNEMIQ
jgi:hypothetical protein